MGVGRKSGKKDDEDAKKKCKESPAIFVQGTAQDEWEDNVCWSGVGYKGHTDDVTVLNLDKGCHSLGVAAHEIGHAIGMLHEQSRPDRDNYVKILWSNIEDEDDTRRRRRSSL